MTEFVHHRGRRPSAGVPRPSTPPLVSLEVLMAAAEGKSGSGRRSVRPINFAAPGRRGTFSLGTTPCQTSARLDVTGARYVASALRLELAPHGARVACVLRWRVPSLNGLLSRWLLTNSRKKITHLSIIGRLPCLQDLRKITKRTWATIDGGRLTAQSQTWHARTCDGGSRTHHPVYETRLRVPVTGGCLDPCRSAPLQKPWLP